VCIFLSLLQSKQGGQEPELGEGRYLAPELLSGDLFSKAADVFSLGITVLEVAVDLDVPFTGALFEALRSVDRQRLPDKLMERAGLSDDLVQIIRDMLRPDPRKRPTVDDLLSRPAVQKVAVERKLSVVSCEVVSTFF
jgi:membrane-associated tyrosine/threonine-specific cdc2-inhibitory kinase